MLTPDSDRLLFLNELSAQLYTLSIRMCTDGFVCLIETLSEQNHSDNNDSIYVACPLSTGKTLQDSFYEYPFLTLPYSKVFVHYHPLSFVLIPSGLNGIDEKGWWGLAASNPQDKGQQEVQSYPIEIGLPTLICSWTASTQSFILRTYPGVVSTPTTLTLCKEAIKCSRTSHKRIIAAELFAASVDILICHSGQLLFANSYSWPASSETYNHLQQVLYFIGLVMSTTEDFAQHSGDVILLHDGECAQNKKTIQTIKSLVHHFSNSLWEVQIANLFESQNLND